MIALSLVTSKTMTPSGDEQAALDGEQVPDI
jgi:hypothetical protein